MSVECVPSAVNSVGGLTSDEGPATEVLFGPEEAEVGVCEISIEYRAV